MRSRLVRTTVMAALLLVAREGRPAPCPTTDDSVLAAREAVHAACGCPESPRGFRDCVRHEVSALRKAKRLAKRCARTLQRIVRRSLCGRGDGVQICCRRTRPSGIVKSGRCHGGDACLQASRTPKDGVFLSSVYDVCRSAACVVVTSSTSTTEPSSTTTTSSTPTTVPTTVGSTVPPPTLIPPQGLLDFELLARAGDCGHVYGDAACTQQIATLGCGGLDIGGGKASVPPEGPTPDGSTNRMELRDCEGTVCRVLPSFEATDAVDCTHPGCRFGTPLPIFGSPATCVVNTFAEPVSGTIDLAAGTTNDLAFSLASNVFLTASFYLAVVGGEVVGLPCPVCVESAVRPVPLTGSPSQPATGVCNGGARALQPCTTRNSGGLASDCPPGGTEGGSRCLPENDPGTPENETTCIDRAGVAVANLGTIAVDLTPLGTSASTTAREDGRFCPAQAGAGCFAAELAEQGASGPACRCIVADGRAFGDLRAGGPREGVLGSVFCIPLTNNGIVDLSANLPGPGAVTLPGTFTYTAVANLPTSTTTSSTTSSSTTSSSTTTPLATSTSTTSSSTTTSTAPTSTTTTAPAASTTTSTTTTSAPSSTTSTTGSTSPTTSTTSTSTTTVATSSTTTTTIPASLDFVAASGTGPCGDTRRNNLSLLRTLECGKLYIGGGNAQVQPSTNPSGVVNRMLISGCVGPVCTLAPTAAPTGPDGSIECTDTGCFFGSPVPIPNFGTSSCVINTFAAPISGTIDIAEGTSVDLSFKLTSTTYITGNAVQPCPRCVTGTPGAPFAPRAGTCDRGARAGLRCITTNPQGLSRDCQPLAGEVDDEQATQLAGALAIDLSPLTTGSRVEADFDVTFGDGGLFCPDQGQGAQQRGCFVGGNLCRQITVNGAPGGSLLPLGSSHSARFASIFCIPATSSQLLNVGAGLPGPGATTIIADLILNP